MNGYDFDGTLYQGDSSVDFFLFEIRRNPRILKSVPHQIKGFILYFFKRISKTELKEHYFDFIKHIDIEAEVTEFWTKHKKKIDPRNIKEGDVIISASPEFLLKPISDEYKVHLIASRVDKDGKFLSENCFGEEKVRRFLKEFRHLETFYTDSETDFSMNAVSDLVLVI